jgi:hypothetical protein
MISHTRSASVAPRPGGAPDIGRSTASILAPTRITLDAGSSGECPWDRFDATVTIRSRSFVHLRLSNLFPAVLQTIAES